MIERHDLLAARKALSATDDFLSKLQKSGPGRPTEPPHLVPRQPTTVLGWTMRKLRQAHDVTVTQTAAEYGCSISHISRVEHGSSKPSRALVQFYENRFQADGLLLSLFEVAEYAGEQDRRRAGGRRPRPVRAIEGDATAYVDETVPHGTLMVPGQRFVKTWRIRNVGTVPWRGRRLERQGPLTGPGLITSERFVPVPDTKPREIAQIQAFLKAPGYDCTSIAYFKMVDEVGLFCFPDAHQLGLDVVVRVVRNTSGWQSRAT
ncbi:MAG TPA: NBR1-Ig-like domain-containing protein [Gaiellaceae bacterium]